MFLLGLLLSGVLSGVLLMTAPSEAGVLDASWTAPTTNTDGSPLTDLASYRVYYGPSSSPYPGSSFFQVASPTPSPPSNQTVTFRLTGLATGTLYYASVTAVDTSGSESACATPLGSAVARIDFAVSPTGTMNFGSVNLGSVADQTFTVSNTGGGTASGTASTSAPFSIVSGSPFSLVGAGANQAVTVRFTPTTSATATVNVTFTGDGDATSRLVTGTGNGTDTTPPTVAITAPIAGATVAGTVTVSAGASDNVGVVGVQFSLDGANLGAEVTTAPCSVSWNTTTAANGTHTLTAVARDAAGNTATSASVSVTVSNSRARHKKH